MKIENQEASECRLQIQLFGTFDVRVNEMLIPPLRSRKVQWLLALLVLRHDQALDRVWLAGTLWPESAPTQALGNLRQSLSNLRHALGEDCLCLHSHTVNSLSLDVANAEVDVLRFDAATGSGNVASLERAVALYRGPLLEGCTEEWVMTERRVREESYLRALEKLADLARASGDRSMAIKYLRLAAHADPFRETTQRVLIQALAEAGDYSAAVQTYRDLRLLLRRELNSDPDAETVALFEQIRHQARSKTPVRPARPVLSGETRSASARNLPLPLTALVGRRSELNEIFAAMRQSRLLTLTGPGGVGKTRLAIAAVEELAEEYPDGVFFVDLAPLINPDLIALTVAAALQVREQAGRSPLLTLQEYLQSKTLLLLLDNCEHLLDGCARFTDNLLKNCPRVSVLATSRQALGLTGEIMWAVPPLPTPSLTHFFNSKSGSLRKEWLSLLSEYEAVQLFVVRARQALPAFQMTAHNAEAVAQICVHLDGIPLALELAAARVRFLSVKEISRRLDNRFHLLTGGSRTAMPRQQTLRALIDWSYELLNPSEKVLLCGLSVFAGGWTLQAAEEVYSGASRTAEEGMSSWEVLHGLTSLTDKSLVVYEERAGEARYRLLETVRQYARERLRESGETDPWHLAHRNYFLRLAEEAQEKLGGPEQEMWVQHLETEHDNLRAALDFCLNTPKGVEVGLQLAGALQQFWWTHGHLSEGRDRLAALLACPETQPPTQARAQALNGAGSLAWMQGDYAAARSFYIESLTLGQELGDKQGIARAMGNLGTVANVQGDYAAAHSYFEESLAIKRDLKDKRGVANTLVGLGNLAMEQGDYAAARLLGEESLALAQEMEDKRSVARSLINLGNLAHLQGDYAAAHPLYEASLELQRDLGDNRGIARSLSNLGNVAMEQGDDAVARSLFEEGLALQRELGDKDGILHSLCNLGCVLGKQGDYSAASACLRECLMLCQELNEKWVRAYALEGCAELAHRQQHVERSIQIYAAAQALRVANGSPLPPKAQEKYERQLAALREVTGEERFLAAWAEGQARTLKQAMAYVFEEGSKLGLISRPK